MKQSPKQIVLNQYPNAVCVQYQPGHWIVYLDDAVHPSPKDADVGGTPLTAWQRAVRKIGAQNARDTNSPFVL